MLSEGLGRTDADAIYLDGGRQRQANRVQPGTAIEPHRVDAPFSSSIGVEPGGEAAAIYFKAADG